MFLSLLLSACIVTEHLCMEREGCIFNVSISERSKVNCAMVGGKTKGDITFVTVGILSIGNGGGG